MLFWQQKLAYVFVYFLLETIDIIIIKKGIVLSSMLVKRHRNSYSYECSISKKQKIQTFNIFNIRAKRQSSQIKQHQKAYNYTNARSYLIENTKRVIKQKKCQTHQKCHTLQTTNQPWSSLLRNRKVTRKNQLGTSIRQSRRVVTSNFRKKIWKSNEMSPLVKFQQKRLTLTQQDYNDPKANQTEQKIRRYKDTTPIKMQQLEFNRQNIKNQQIQRTYQRSRRSNNSKKNPQNINTCRKQSKQMMNQTNSKGQTHTNQQMHHYFNLLQEQNRPNTAGNSNRANKRMSDSIIQLEPW